MYATFRPFTAPALAAACALAIGCGTPLLTPEAAQDRMYDHLARAEAFRQSRMFQAARYQQEQAARYREMIKEGRTTTPEQAMAKAAQHRQQAEALQRIGYTRFVPQELEKAAMLEEFALEAGGLTVEQLERSAQEHLRKAAEYDLRDLRQFARHHRDQATKLRRAVWAR